MRSTLSHLFHGCDRRTCVGRGGDSWNARQALYDGLERANDALDLDRHVPAAAARTRLFELRLKDDETSTPSIGIVSGHGGTFKKMWLDQIGRHPGSHDETKR
ncbi:hypothetical protein H310_12002 [Aphanomyces invadans]|uniref:Uncharacterized protein n=1 Tax=Aphanomyces invadans TaxID=157072 RepID=A0A024TM14_9STRA|nr:hypothetical protein H310_12002 [Aphanomyces invadans]ETV94362.1 hypothetical protein H310_12002 [Aphanomyces invadans]|eukprot:XP_008877124.1 hypothetical protein H310_12002 [Aphanomyces invadans]